MTKCGISHNKICDTMFPFLFINTYTLTVQIITRNGINLLLQMSSKYAIKQNAL